MERRVSLKPSRPSSNRPTSKSAQGLDKRKGASEEPTKSKQAREEARARAKLAEEAIRNTGILQRELKAAQAERTQCGKVEDNSVIRQDAQPTEKMPMRKMDTGPALDQGSGLGSGILRHRNCQEQGNTMLDLKMSPNSTSGPALPSNPLQHVRSTDVAPSSASLKSHALAPDTFLDSPQIFKTQEHSHQRSEQHGGLSAEANRSAIGETPDLIRKSSSGGHPDNTPQRQLPVDRRTNIVDCRAAGSDPGQRNAIKVDAVSSLLRSDSSSPPLQSSRNGGHRFLSSLGELKAGTTAEQKLHAAAQRQNLVRDLEEQVRLKKAQKEAQRAAERAAEEREEAKLREHYARKSIESSKILNNADVTPQSTESSPAVVSDSNAALRHSASNNSDLVDAHLADGQTQLRSRPCARESASTSPTWQPLSTESDERRHSQVVIPTRDCLPLRASIIKSPDTVKLSAFCGPLAEMNRGMHSSYRHVHEAHDPAEDENAQDGVKRVLKDGHQVQELLHELQLQQAALAEQFARHELALEELRTRSPPGREHLQGGLSIPPAAAVSQQTQDLPCTSNLVTLDVSHIPERLGDVQRYLFPLQEVASVCPAQHSEGRPISLPFKQSTSSTDCQPDRKSVKGHALVAAAVPKNRTGPSLAVGHPVPSAARKQLESNCRGLDKSQSTRSVRRAWAR